MQVLDGPMPCTRLAVWSADMQLVKHLQQAVLLQLVMYKPLYVQVAFVIMIERQTIMSEPAIHTLHYKSESNAHARLPL